MHWGSDYNNGLWCLQLYSHNIRVKGEKTDVMCPIKWTNTEYQPEFVIGEEVGQTVLFKFQNKRKIVYSEASFIRDAFIRKHRYPDGFPRERKNAT